MTTFIFICIYNGWSAFASMLIQCAHLNFFRVRAVRTWRTALRLWRILRENQTSVSSATIVPCEIKNKNIKLAVRDIGRKLDGWMISPSLEIHLPQLPSLPLYIFKTRNEHSRTWVYATCDFEHTLIKQKTSCCCF